MGDVRVNLSQRYGAQAVRADCMEEFLAIRENIRAGIPVGETEIQHALLFRLPRAILRRGQANAARASTKSVDQPAKMRERRRFEDLQAARAAQIPACVSHQGRALPRR
jgi:hypothetical protein